VDESHNTEEEDEDAHQEEDDEAPGLQMAHTDAPVLIPKPPEVQDDLPGVQDELPGLQDELPGVPDEDEFPEVPAEIPGVQTCTIHDNAPGSGDAADGNDDAPPLRSNAEDNNDSDDEDDKDSDAREQEIPDDEVFHPNTTTPSVQSTYALRPKRSRDYSHLHANIVHHAMTQYYLNKGLRKFKEKGEKVIEKDLEELHIEGTLTPVNVVDL
jgi:hypothetical protein